MTLIGALLTSLVIAREWERGTMEAIMATPVTINQVLLGKLIPYFVLGMGSMLLCTGVAAFLYDVPFRGSILALTLVSCVFLLAALGQGLLISSVAKNQFVAAQIALMSAFLPAFMLSGFIFEISAMPVPIRLLTSVFAARYFVTCLQTLFLTGNIWSLVFRCTAAMAAIALVFFLITSKKTHKRLDA
jgi:ABC-2 type transport system permease protein